MYINPQGGKGLNVASYGDLDGFDWKPDQVRQRKQIAQLETLLQKKLDVSKINPWCGLRACTPDDNPIVGKF